MDIKPVAWLRQCASILSQYFSAYPTRLCTRTGVSERLRLSVSAVVRSPTRRSGNSVTLVKHCYPLRSREAIQNTFVWNSKLQNFILADPVLGHVYEPITNRLRTVMTTNQQAFLRAFGFFCFLTALPCTITQAEDQVKGRSDHPANPSHDGQSEFYTSTRVHKMHLELSKDEWNAMAPVDGRSAKASGAEPSTSSAARPVHRNRFPWSVGSVLINGETLNGAGVRYKGNASFNLMKGSLKRNLKVKLDWTDGKQRYSGAKTLNLNAGGLDPSKLRDALGYAVFRQAGVPASRTTFAEVSLTVPGVHDNVHLGLFTMVEQVNKAFLKSRFGNSKGLLMKPEGVLSVEFRGEDWAAYEEAYRPDDPPTAEQTKRLIEFAKLVNLTSDKEFKASIDSYLDTDGFLRFIAVNALIVNLDTLLVMPQNYYVYLNPATDKFVFFPWDLDISFAGWPLGGPPEKQMQLSLEHPHAAGGHKLIDRLFSIPDYRTRYENIIDELVAGTFAEVNLREEVESLQLAIREAIRRDTAAINSRKERGYPAPRGYQPPALLTFVAERHASIRQQLQQDAAGYVYARPQPPFGRSQLALHVLVQGDTDSDRRLSKQELVMLFGRWFDAMDQDGKGSLNQQDFIQRMPDALFPADFPHKRPPRVAIPEPYVAEGLFSALALPQRDVVTKERMTSVIGEWYDRIDPDADDRLDRRQLTNAFRKLIPH